MSEKNGINCWATVETRNTKSNWHAASGHKSEEGRRIRLNTSKKSIRLDRIRWIDTTELLNANKFYATTTATRKMVNVSGNWNRFLWFLIWWMNSLKICNIEWNNVSMVHQILPTRLKIKINATSKFGHAENMLNDHHYQSS